jgi:hypothetical protein
MLTARRPGMVGPGRQYVAIAPGFCDAMAAVANDAKWQANAAQTFIGRNGELPDLAGFAIYLASRASDYDQPGDLCRRRILSGWIRRSSHGTQRVTYRDEPNPRAGGGSADRRRCRHLRPDMHAYHGQSTRVYSSARTGRRNSREHCMCV